MKLTIENTPKIVDLDGTPARVWEGHTESGIAVLCLITRVAIRNDSDQVQFERELSEQKAPSPAVEAIPCRMIL